MPSPFPPHAEQRDQAGRNEIPEHHISGQGDGVKPNLSGNKGTLGVGSVASGVKDEGEAENGATLNTERRRNSRQEAE